MWKTPLGERALTDEEASLCRVGLARAIRYLELEATVLATRPWTYGISPFDQLPWRCRLELLVIVSECLFDPAIKAPVLNLETVSAVQVIFASVRQSIEVEIDDHRAGEQTTTVRQLLLNVCLTALPTHNISAPSVDCEDPDHWLPLIALAANKVLEPRPTHDNDLKRSTDDGWLWPPSSTRAHLPPPLDEDIPALWKRAWKQCRRHA